jgi:hypothetical protein
MANAADSTRWLHLTRFPEPAIALLVFIAALAYFNSTMYLTLELRDEGLLLSNIARAAHGEIPHRDFIALYAPGLHAVTAPIFRIFGERVLPLRELLAVFRAAAVVMAYLIARHLVPRSFALLGAFVAAAYWGRVIWNLNTPYAALFTIPLCMFSLLLLLHGQSRLRRAAYVWSGIVCGAALMFKWSLAAVSAYGMVLAICANAMLREPPPGSARARRAPVLFAWMLAGAVIVVPFLSSMAPFDYLLHFAPIHAVIALVAIRFARCGEGRSALARAAPLVARYCAGFLVVPVLVFALYSYWGAAGDLLYNTVYRASQGPGYYQPVDVPPAANVLLLVCVVAWASAGLALLRGSRRAAVGFVALGLACAPAAYAAIEGRWNPSFALDRLTLQLPAITAFAGVALLAGLLSRTRPSEAEPSLDALIAALLFQEMMAFQIFPRGGYNVTLMSGTTAPVVAYLSYRWYLFARVDDTRQTPVRRSIAFALAALLPVLAVGEVVRESISEATADKPAYTALHSPALAGIRPRPFWYKAQGLAAFDELIIHLEKARPVDAPVFALQNEPMIYFASGREHLFEDHALLLFLACWNLLPENDRDRPTPSAMIDRLEETPEAIIIIRLNDPTYANFVESFPEVHRYIQRNHRIERAFGDYRVMRHKRAGKRRQR